MAVSDRSRQIASPRQTIRRTKFSPDAARLPPRGQAAYAYMSHNAAR